MDAARLRLHALAALRGLAVGDAMGAATEGYQPDEVEEVYEGPIAELTEPVNLYPEEVPDRERGVVAPVTRAALAAVEALAESRPLGADRAALGWAVTLGIVAPAGSPDLLAREARALAGDALAAVGAAVAAAVAAGVSGFMARDAVALAMGAAEAAGDPLLAQRIGRAAGLGQASGGRRVGAAVRAEFPPWPAEEDAAIFAFGVAFGAQNARRAILEAVNQGGLASLAAGLVGAICAALTPSSLVEAWAHEVELCSGIDLGAVVDRVLAVRQRHAEGP